MRSSHTADFKRIDRCPPALLRVGEIRHTWHAQLWYSSAHAWEMNSHTSVMVSSDYCNKNVIMSIQVSVCFYSGISCMGMYQLV